MSGGYPPGTMPPAPNPLGYVDNSGGYKADGLYPPPPYDMYAHRPGGAVSPPPMQPVASQLPPHMQTTPQPPPPAMVPVQVGPPLQAPAVSTVETMSPRNNYLNEINSVLDHAERVNAMAEKYRLEADYWTAEAANTRATLEMERRSRQQAGSPVLWDPMQFEAEVECRTVQKIAPFRAMAEDATNALRVTRQKRYAISPEPVLLGGPPPPLAPTSLGPIGGVLHPSSPTALSAHHHHHHPQQQVPQHTLHAQQQQYPHMSVQNTQTQLSAPPPYPTTPYSPQFSPTAGRPISPSIGAGQSTYTQPQYTPTTMDYTTPGAGGGHHMTPTTASSLQQHHIPGQTPGGIGVYPPGQHPQQALQQMATHALGSIHPH